MPACCTGAPAANWCSNAVHTLPLWCRAHIIPRPPAPCFPCDRLQQLCSARRWFWVGARVNRTPGVFKLYLHLSSRQCNDSHEWRQAS
jgi:hypothetical protein